MFMLCLLGLVVALCLVFVRWETTKDGNYRAFLWLGSVFYEIVQSKIYDLRMGANGKTWAELKDPATLPNNEYGGGLSVWRFGGLVVYLNFFVKPQGVVPLGVKQVSFTLADVETTEEDGSHVALGLDFMFKQRNVGPYLRQFNVEPGIEVDGEIKKRVTTGVRGWVYSKKVAEVQAAKGNGEEMWKDLTDPSRPPLNLNCLPVFDEIRNQWGVEIVPNSISVGDVRLPQQIQDAQRAKFQAELEAQAELLRQEIGANTFAAQTSGAEVAMLSKWTGRPVAELQKEVKDAVATDAEHGLENWLKKYPMVAKNWALIQNKQLGVRPNLYGNADGSSMDQLMVALMSLISLAKGGGDSGGGGDYGGQGNRDNRGKGPGGGSGPDDEILRQNPAKLSPADLAKYNEALRRRAEKRRNKNRSGGDDDE